MSAKEVFAVDVPEEVATALSAATRDMQIRIERFAAEQQAKLLEEIRPKVKDIKGFWTVALLNHPVIGGSATASDREALKHLTDIELIRDAKDPRAYELVFHFDDNEFFTNKTLSKKYSLPEGAAAAPADGSITDEIRDFEPSSLVAPAVEIDWKEGKDLVKLHPRKVPTVEDLENLDQEDDFEGDVGSWFHYFTTEGDMFEIGEAIIEEILQDPYKYFQGEDEISDDEDDELDEEEDDDEEGSIDLEEDEEEGPAKKKQKK